MKCRLETRSSVSMLGKTINVMSKSDSSFSADSGPQIQSVNTRKAGFFGYFTKQIRNAPACCHGCARHPCFLIGRLQRQVKRRLSCKQNRYVQDFWCLRNVVRWRSYHLGSTGNIRHDLLNSREVHAGWHNHLGRDNPLLLQEWHGWSGTMEYRTRRIARKRDPICQGCHHSASTRTG